MQSAFAVSEQKMWRYPVVCLGFDSFSICLWLRLRCESGLAANDNFLFICLFICEGDQKVARTKSCEGENQKVVC